MHQSTAKFKKRRDQMLAWVLPVLVVLNLAASWATVSVTGGDSFQIAYWQFTACAFLAITLCFFFSPIDRGKTAWVTIAAMGLTALGAEVLLFTSGYLDNRENSMFVALFAYIPLIYLFSFILLPAKPAFKVSLAIWLTISAVTLYFVIPQLSEDQQGAADLLVFMTIGQPLAILIVRTMPQLESDLQNSESLRAAAEKEAITDPLTHLLNRRGYDDQLFQHWNEIQSNEQLLLLALIDIDHFKQYNDTVGHVQGDRCLVEVSKSLQQFATRHQLDVARYGGEEFALLGQVSSAADARNIAENANRCIRALQLEHPASDIESPTLTASIGYATQVAKSGDVRHITAAADAALYSAKRSGRNCVKQSESN
ncbi:MAG: GGDEF domain-containing protein [Gammaproteobacteria bacterium]|nr:GGDEF domain-containing protein [Gammaproteobacteria bacterium]